MFDVLTRGFRNARLKLQGKAELTEENISEALREVRTSLIQADVQIGVVRDFMDRVKTKALGEIVPLTLPDGSEIKVTPQDHFIKSCYDEMVDLMGPVDTSLSLEGNPSVVMMVGLQGSGKTTTAGKLAKRLLAEGHKPLLVAADIYRPAAIDQLMVVGRKLGVPVFSIKGMDPVTLSKMAVTQARNLKRDVVIIDTAGRLAIDNELMIELEQIKTTVHPENIFFVVDAMIGQDSVRTAQEFDRRLDFTGFILTKLDGDARGGAALSIKEVTGKPIKFLGQGEELDRLEEFRPEGLAQRILGFGDVVGLMQDFEKHIDKEEAEADAAKMLKGEFSYDDFVKQIKNIRRMGPLREVFARLPMINELMDQLPPEAMDDEVLSKTLAIIQSMTREERKHPDLLSRPRFARIARGCGRSVQDVTELHERFLMARQMMSGLGNMISNPDAMREMQRSIREGMGGKGLAKPELSVDEKAERRQKQLERRRGRKRGQ
ncbi:MAG: signal recognition particle protein [Deltaproteobacteria bacterium]|nr:signal recognition particle protein [Deltaproteobacteria bacterium]